MVSTKGDQFGMYVTFRVAVAEGSAGEEFQIGGGHLVEGQGVVEGCDGDVSAVENQGP